LRFWRFQLSFFKFTWGCAAPVEEWGLEEREEGTEGGGEGGGEGWREKAFLINFVQTAI